MSNTARLPYERSRSQGWLKLKKLNFRHVHFLCDFCAISGGRKAARHARLLQDCCIRTTSIIVRHPRICFTKAARLPQDNHALYCKTAARMLRNVRLQLKIAQWPQGCSAGTEQRIALSCDSLANFAWPSCGSLAHGVR